MKRINFLLLISILFSSCLVTKKNSYRNTDNLPVDKIAIYNQYGYKYISDFSEGRAKVIDNGERFFY